MFSFRTFLARMVLFVGLIPAFSIFAPAAALDLGPIVCHDQSLTGETRWRALGPLLEFTSNTNGMKLCAVRPFFSREYEFEQHKIIQDVCWPVWTGKKWDDISTQWRCLLLVSWRNDDINDPQSRCSFRVFPVYFQGRNDEGESYWALFPLGGKIHNIFFYDTVKFLLFPLYGRTKVNDLQGVFALWPILSRSWNDEIERHRLFPFYGYSRRRDDFERYFVLWPFWNHVRYGYQGASGTGFVLFPLIGRVNLEDQSTWMFLPPFFRFSRGARKSQAYMPWPFIQIGRGEIDQKYLWPVAGLKRSQGYEYSFLVWPICTRVIHFSEESRRSRTWVLPFVYLTDAQQNFPKPEMQCKVRKIWPLFTMCRENDHSLLRAPTLLPFRDLEPIDRNYAPIWTLYSREATVDCVEHEAFWGVYRHRRTLAGVRNFTLFPLAQYARQPRDNSFSWSFLHGAVGYSRNNERRYVRLLYFIKINLSLPQNL